MIVFDNPFCFSGLSLKLLLKNLGFISFGLATMMISSVHGLAQDVASGQFKSGTHPALEIDDQRIAANGIRRLEGKHIVLYTDLRDRADIDELVTVFDQAAPQWCDFFGVDKNRIKSWRVVAFLIEDRARFEKAKLIPGDLPNFLAGFSRGDEIWVYLQPGDYYTRHLVLHEGTHSFMQRFLGGSGPPWYSEGMAELLALHRWQNDKLELNFRVTENQQAEYWGRPKKLRQAKAADALKTIDDVMAIDRISAHEVDSYAWSWALCEFLRNHPQTQKPFSELASKCQDASVKFTIQFRERLNSIEKVIARDWRLFVDEMDYGIEANRVAVADARESQANEFKIRSNHGWQATSFEVKKGDRLKICASGQFQVAESSKPWVSEGGGITIDYYRGRPLGMLLVGVIRGEQIDNLLNPKPVGVQSEIVFESNGRLCFRINDSPARMDDNRGELTVNIEKINQ